MPRRNQPITVICTGSLHKQRSDALNVLLLYISGMGWDFKQFIGLAHKYAGDRVKATAVLAESF